MCKLFVGTKSRQPFPGWIRSEDLEDHFDECGPELIRADVIYRDQKSLGYGILSFSSRTAADAAIEKYDGTRLLESYRLHVDYKTETRSSSERAPSSPKTPKSRQSAMSKSNRTDYDEADIKDRYPPRSHPEIPASSTESACAVFVGTKKQRSLPASVGRTHIEKHFAQFHKHIERVERVKGHAVVTFSSRKAAQSAIDILDGTILKEINLQVSFLRFKSGADTRPSPSSKPSIPKYQQSQKSTSSTEYVTHQDQTKASQGHSKKSQKERLSVSSSSVHKGDGARAGTVPVPSETQEEHSHAYLSESSPRPSKLISMQPVNYVVSKAPTLQKNSATLQEDEAIYSCAKSSSSIARGHETDLQSEQESTASPAVQSSVHEPPNLDCWPHNEASVPETVPVLPSQSQPASRCVVNAQSSFTAHALEAGNETGEATPTGPPVDHSTHHPQVFITPSTTTAVVYQHQFQPASTPVSPDFTGRSLPIPDLAADGIASAVTRSEDYSMQNFFAPQSFQSPVPPASLAVVRFQQPHSGTVPMLPGCTLTGTSVMLQQAHPNAMLLQPVLYYPPTTVGQSLLTATNRHSSSATGTAPHLSVAHPVINIPEYVCSTAALPSVPENTVPQIPMHQSSATTPTQVEAFAGSVPEPPLPVSVSTECRSVAQLDSIHSRENDAIASQVVPYLFPESSSTIIITGLKPSYSRDTMRMLLQKHQLESCPYEISPNSTEATVQLSSPRKAANVVRDMTGEEILGQELKVSVVGAAQSSVTEHEFSSPSDTVEIVDEQSYPAYLYEYLSSHCYDELVQFRSQRGIIIPCERGKRLKAPRSVLLKFNKSVREKARRAILYVESDDVNRLSAVGKDGSSLLSLLSSHIASTWDVKVHLEPEQLAIMVVGQTKEISLARKHLLAALAGELRVDPIKLEALIFFVPELDREVLKKSGVTVRGYTRGSVELIFEGPSGSLQEAKEEIKGQLSELKYTEMTFRHCGILVKSAQKRLQLDGIQAYLHCTEGIEQSPPIPLLVVYRREIDKTATLEIVHCDPYKQTITPSNENAVLTVRSKMSKLEGTHCVAIKIQQEHDHLVVISSFVLKDVESVVKKLKRSLDDLISKDVPLKCLPEHYAYLRIVLLLRPTEAGRTLLNSISPVILSWSKTGQIVMNGAAHLLEKAESQILQSVLMKDLLFKVFTFTCDCIFMRQIDECVLKLMRKKQVSIYNETFEKPQAKVTSDGKPPPTFSVSISCKTPHSTDFDEVCKILEALNPYTDSYPIHPYVVKETQNIVKRLDSKIKHRTVVFVNTMGRSPSVDIRGLCQEDITATWSEITTLLDTKVETVQNIEVNFFQVKYLVFKHLQAVQSMKQQCKVELPHIDRLPELDKPVPPSRISIAGIVKDVNQVKVQLQELISECEINQFSIRFPSRSFRTWTERWKQLRKEQDKCGIFIDFQPTKAPIEMRRSSEPSRADGASCIFVVYGNDKEGIKKVRRLIEEEENGQKLMQQKVDLTDVQVEADTLHRGLIQRKLVLETKYSIIMELHPTRCVTLYAPPCKEFEAILLLVKEDIMKFIKENEKTTEIFLYDDSLVWAHLLPACIADINKLAIMNKVHFKTLKEGNQMELKGAPVHRTKMVEALQTMVEAVGQTLCKDRLMLKLFEAPVLATTEFAQFILTLERELRVKCRYPNKEKNTNKVVREFNFVSQSSICVQLCQGDLTIESVDAIVNAANEDLQHIGGLALEISRVGGPSIQRESDSHVKKHGKVLAGEAVCLGSGRLPCMRIIHAVAPRWVKNSTTERQALSHAFYCSLECAEKEGLRSVSLPALGAGIFCVPMQICAQTAKQAVQSYQSDNPASQIRIIRFVVLTQQNIAVFEKEFEKTMEPVLTVSEQKYQWSWADDSGGFSPYPQPTSDSLTSAFASSLSRSHTCIINGNHYEVNFQTMLQTNCGTGYQRRVKRMPIADRAPALQCTPSASAGHLSSPQWHYEDEQNQFVAYAPSDSVQLEKMYNGEIASCQLVICRRVYNFNFERLEQTNVSTGKTRRMRRDGSNRKGFKEDDVMATVTIRGLTDDIEEAKTRIREKATSLIKKYQRELPSSAAPDFVEKLVEIAQSCGVYCKVKEKELVRVEEEAAVKSSKQGASARQVIKLKGLAELVDRATTKIQEEIIELQSRTRVIVSSGGFVLPPEWEEQSEMFKLVEMTPGTEEWCRIETTFKETLGTATVVAIKRIQNKWLWEKYCQEKGRMCKKNAGDVNEKELFHGSRRNDPEKIYSSEEGFDMRHSNAGMWGQANYFAEDARYSNGYAYQASNYGYSGLYRHSYSTEKEMFLAKVLTGDSYQCSSNRTLRLPPEKTPVKGVNLKQVRYDSVNGVTGGSRVYMTYANDRAYPAYLIRYT